MNSWIQLAMLARSEGHLVPFEINTDSGGWWRPPESGLLQTPGKGRRCAARWHQQRWQESTGRKKFCQLTVKTQENNREKLAPFLPRLLLWTACCGQSKKKQGLSSAREATWEGSGLLSPQFSTISLASGSWFWSPRALEQPICMHILVTSAATHCVLCHWPLNLPLKLEEISYFSYVILTDWPTQSCHHREKLVWHLQRRHSCASYAIPIKSDHRKSVPALQQ